MSFGASSGKSSSQSKQASVSNQASHQEDYSIVNMGLTDQAANEIKSYLNKYFNQASQQALNQTAIGQNLSAAQQDLANAALKPQSTANFAALDGLSDLLGLPRASGGSQAVADYNAEQAKVAAFNAQNQGKSSAFQGTHLDTQDLTGDLQKKMQAWQALTPIYGAQQTGKSQGKGGSTAAGTTSTGGKGGTAQTNPGPTSVPGPYGNVPVTQPTPAQVGTTQVPGGKGGSKTVPVTQGPVIGYQGPSDPSALGYFGEGGGIYQNSMTPQTIQVQQPSTNGKGGTKTVNQQLAPGQTPNIVNANNSYQAGEYVKNPGITASSSASVGKGKDAVSASTSINSNPLGRSQQKDNQTVYPSMKSFTGLDPSVVNSMQDQLAQIQSFIQDGNYKNVDAVLLDKLFGKNYTQHFWENGQITDDFLANNFVAGTDAQGNPIYTAKDSSILGNDQFKNALAVLTPYVDPNNPLGSKNYQIAYKMKGDDPSKQLTNPQDTQAAALAQITNSPGYQFALNQGMGAINAKAAASGMFRSGANTQDILKYGQDYAQSAYQQRIGQLTQMLGITSPSLMQISQQGQNQANNTSAGQSQLANLLPTILGTQGSAYSNLDQAANQIFNRFLTGVGDSAGSSASAGESSSKSSQSGFSVGL